ncbi:hypothetical protein PCASD_20629 [Puccinia coronata f. sp. avenae]|uniref:Uncharacterized protein n=1 Tax=Puccinia coronata f. sp. avenae TaxID=200324 RepID=A0A2N5U192_9BASI|nr:hypothetical protein PCASD_20629 [Puccinia coronata f. sp. avenae]
MASDKSDSSDAFNPEITKRAADQLSQAMPRILLPKKLLKLSRNELKDYIRQFANDTYGDDAKDKQIDAVAHLVHSEHTFVLAGIYLRLFKPYQKPVIVVLNPLDALGDNQVR